MIHCVKVTSLVICLLLLNSGFHSLQADKIVSKENLQSFAKRIAEVSTRYDILMRDLDFYSHSEYPAHDSLTVSRQYGFLMSDSSFHAETRTTSRYQTTKYGFEEFEVTTFPNGRYGHDYSYNIALGYDGGAYRLKGFSKSDFQNLTKRVFSRVRTIEEAKLIAKWYFGFQNISLAFHEKVLSPKLNKEIVRALKSMKATSERDYFTLVDYSTTIDLTLSSFASDSNRVDADVFINRSSIRINKTTCSVTAQNDRFTTVRLRNVSPEEYQVHYLF